MHWSIFFSVYPLLDAGEIREDLHAIGGFPEQFSGPRAASGTIFRSHMLQQDP
jgi:hypothetical protein